MRSRPEARPRQASGSGSRSTTSSVRIRVWTTKRPTRDTGEIESTLVDLMKQYKRYRWAVAWASVGFGAWDALVRHKGRIHRIVIGTQFHQTHPKVISLFHRHPGVRFVRDPSGVFHHKVYLFENGPKSWTAVIGRANFTQAAFKQNKESVVIIDADDEGAGNVKNAIDRCLNDSWSHADRNIDQQWVRFYTDGWERKMERLRRLANRPRRSPEM